MRVEEPGHFRRLLVRPSSDTARREFFRRVQAHVGRAKSLKTDQNADRYLRGEKTFEATGLTSPGDGRIVRLLA
jgi:hypothetical protein